MAITHPDTPTRNALADLVVDQLDGGSIVLQNAGGTDMAEVELDTPAYGAASGGIAALLGVPLTGPVTVTDTVTQFEARNSAGTAIYAGTAGESGTDLILSEADLTIGDQARINSHSYAAPV